MYTISFVIAANYVDLEIYQGVELYTTCTFQDLPPYLKYHIQTRTS